MRADMILILAVLGIAVVIFAVTGRTIPEPPLPAALLTPRPLPTATPSPTPAWWDQAVFATPALPGLPGLPDVQLGTGGPSGGGGPVAFGILSCPGPSARIAAITGDGVWWRVEGTATDAPFWYWKMELSPDGNGWTVLHHSETPVADGHLMDFRTDTVPAARYQMRLTVVRRDGNYTEPCVIEVDLRRFP